MSTSSNNPRGDLPNASIQSSSYISRLLQADHHCQRQLRTSPLCIPKKPNPKKAPLYNSNPCYDWIFSSASNVHIAVDRSAFKTYTPFKSYVLTVADHRQIPVQGIGSVDLDLRRKKGSRQCHTITLENVLHAPGWFCNVFSDVFFEGLNGEFEHAWGTEGVQFMKKKDEGKLRTWGFTEEFCGLDRLMLARSLTGRSPMLEDREREVFSVNVNFPQGQRDRWEAFAKEQEKKREENSVILMPRDGNIGRRSQNPVALKA
jgi:hypothetical protein